LGEGISHAIGTGSNDLKDAVGAITTLQALDFLVRDDATQVIVLISKPPSSLVASRVLDAARRAGKPVVVYFIGYADSREKNIYFANTLDHAAEIAVALSRGAEAQGRKGEKQNVSRAPALPSSPARFLRGLYSGGTLAYEAQLILRDYLPGIYSNAPLDPQNKLASPFTSQEHSIVDLGSEEFMVGRLHPMIDNDLRIRRLKQEADDPNVAVILLDVVLGYGAHPDPASELAPAISDARVRAARNGRQLEFVAVVVGTDDDPQDYTAQVERLRQTGARVMATHDAAVKYAGELVGSFCHEAAKDGSKGAGEQRSGGEMKTFTHSPTHPISLSHSFAAINVGIESFFDSLKSQDASAIQVEWKPPAGGNEKLMAILAKLKAKS
jgi:FdrA protein